MSEPALEPIHGSRARAAARRLADWFEAEGRELPWRTRPRDPYRSLVSELMLQQTQVARVVEKFHGFLERFPDVRALASAPEDDVLAAWTGLGYYRRARMLHAAARDIVDRFDGRVPEAADELRSLPGVGPYTAGAIASIVFGHPEPIVDGNVARVLLRLEGHERAADDAEARRWAWDGAARLARAGGRLGRVPETNEGLMELGATVCTPRNPDCASCPLARRCRARAEGLTDRIPLPKRAAARTALHCASVIVRDPAGRLLVERRGGSGMWAGMWQAPTLERRDRPPRRAEIVRALRDHPALDAAPARLEHVTGFDHQTTHRAVRFEVYRAACREPGAAPGPSDEGENGWRQRRRWAGPAEVAGLALSNPQRRILLELAPEPEARGA